MSDQYLNLYSKEYHQSHLDWAKEDTPIYRHYRDRYMELIQPQEGLKVLEIGCSSGKTTVELLSRGCHVTAVDFDQTAIDLAKGFVESKNLSKNSKFICCSADDAKLMDLEFDVVTMLDFVEHVPDSVLEGLIKNLQYKKFQGRICIYTPNNLHFTEIMRELGIIRQDATHINLKSTDQWKKYFSKLGLKISKLKRETSHWPGLKTVESLACSIPFIGNLLTRSVSLDCKI